MDLEIRYENGSMTVHLEEFLSERRIAKVRKLLKVIRSSFTPECEQQMKEFIQEQTEQFEQVQKEHSIYIEGYTQKVKYAEQQIMQTKINNAPTAAMVVDTSVASNACGNCGSANNACQCVNDKAGDISVRAAGISGA